jgi:hypothetical protein
VVDVVSDSLAPADVSQLVSAEQVHAQRLTALEAATAKATADITILDRHRERMEARWALVAAFAGVVAGLASTGLYSASTTRDMSRDTAARIVVVEKSLSDLSADARASSTEDRGTHDAIVRLTTTVDGLVRTVEELRSELHTRPAAPSALRR